MERKLFIINHFAQLQRFMASRSVSKMDIGVKIGKEASHYTCGIGSFGNNGEMIEISDSAKAGYQFEKQDLVAICGYIQEANYQTGTPKFATLKDVVRLFVRTLIRNRVIGGKFVGTVTLFRGDPCIVIEYGRFRLKKPISTDLFTQAPGFPIQTDSGIARTHPGCVLTLDEHGMPNGFEAIFNRETGRWMAFGRSGRVRHLSQKADIYDALPYTLDTVTAYFNPELMDEYAKQGRLDDQEPLHGNTLLHLFLMNGRFAEARQLVDAYPVDMTRVNKHGETILWAVAVGMSVLQESWQKRPYDHIIAVLKKCLQAGLFISKDHQELSDMLQRNHRHDVDNVLRDIEINLVAELAAEENTAYQSKPMRPARL